MLQSFNESRANGVHIREIMQHRVTEQLSIVWSSQAEPHTVVQSATAMLDRKTQENPSYKPDNSLKHVFTFKTVRGNACHSSCDRDDQQHQVKPDGTLISRLHFSFTCTERGRSEMILKAAQTASGGISAAFKDALGKKLFKQQGSWLKVSNQTREFLLPTAQ